LIECSARYKEAFNRLRDLKHEIEHMQHLLEKAKVQLMKDFEIWWAEQSAASEVRIMAKY
jgi:kinesin family member 6/9